MKGFVQTLAKRRFNYIDGVYLGVVGSLVAQTFIWQAVAVLLVGVVVSVVVEGIARATGDA